jgi:acyl-coenzyme A synthetase/AMP-(fatty) acid ligase
MLGDPSTLPSLSCVAVGGEALPHNLMLLWSRSGCRLLVTYGVTEVTVYQTIHHVTAADVDHPHEAGRGYLIGRALQGVGVAVVDCANCPVPRGQPGHIVLFGLQLAFGYVGRQDVSDSGGFRTLHVGEERGVVAAYFTGDGGTMLCDGSLLFHGRWAVIASSNPLPLLLSSDLQFAMRNAAT